MIAFIACSKKKLKYKSPAKNLYQGALFKKALQYTSTRYTEIYILSAKYGILGLDDIIEPYDKTIQKMSITERKEWGILVKNQMISRNLKPPFIFFTGSLYNSAFEGEKPLFGLSIGRSLFWFNKQKDHIPSLF